MFGIYRKEMRAYLVSPIPYILLFLFPAFMAWWFFHRGFFVMQTATFESFFGIIPWVFIFLVPAISMRLWSEEVRSGTIEQLMTVPVRSWELVAGKFLSAWTLLGVCLLATVPMAVTVATLGDLDWGPVVGGYLGAFLMGGALLALGTWLSGLSSHQIVAFLLGAFASFILVVMNMLASETGGLLGRMFERLSVAARFEAMGRGVLDMRDVLYFVLFAAFFLYLNAIDVENRRFRG